MLVWAGRKHDIVLIGGWSRLTGSRHRCLQRLGDVAVHRAARGAAGLRVGWGASGTRCHLGAVQWICSAVINRREYGRTRSNAPLTMNLA